MRLQHTFGCSLLSVRLHRDVRVQMVESTISLLATVPSALVHALNFLITSSGSLVLLSARDRDE